MKICCKDFRWLIENIDQYRSLVITNNMDSESDIITHSLAFYSDKGYGKSWHYFKYCPFCSKELEV